MTFQSRGAARVYKSRHFANMLLSSSHYTFYLHKMKRHALYCYERLGSCGAPKMLRTTRMSGEPETQTHLHTHTCLENRNRYLYKLMSGKKFESRSDGVYG
jgi:hypothetical protein